MDASATTAEGVLTLNTCPLCRGQDFRLLATPGHWIGEEVFLPLRGRIGLVRCRSCGLVFVNPRPAPEVLEAFYQGDRYSCHQPAGPGAAVNQKAAHILEILRHCRPDGHPGRLLDFGCGAGDFIAEAAREGWNARGFEPGTEGRNTCVSRGLRVVGTVQELPSAQFDFIALNHVFEHLGDHAATLQELQRLLAPGGRVYIEVPNAGSLRARLSLPLFSRRLGFDERYRAFPIHLCYFDQRTLRRLLESHGFHVERMLTSGLGIEELLARPDKRGREKENGGAAAAATATRPKGGLIRRLVKGAILGSGLGENLAAIFHPVGSPGS